MVLIDTNVISEARKQDKANPGVRAFFREVAAQGESLYLSVVSLSVNCAVASNLFDTEAMSVKPTCLMHG